MSDQPPPPAGPPPGWYPDPTTGEGFRWWDGVSWTEQLTDHVHRSSPGLKPVSEWISEVFRIGANRAGHFFTMIVLLIVPTGLFNGAAFWLALRNVVLITDQDTNEISFTNPGTGGANYALLAASLVLTLLATVWLTVAAVRQTNAKIDEQDEIWSASLLAALRRLPRATGAVVLVSGALIAAYLVLMVGVVLAPLLVLVLFPLWIVGSFLIGTRFSLAHVTAGLAPRSTRSLSTSWRLTKSNFWAVFGRMALLLVVGLSLSLVTGIVAAPFTALAGGSETATLEVGAEELALVDVFGDNPAIFAIGQLFNAIGSGAAAVVWGIGLTLIYRDLQGPVEESE